MKLIIAGSRALPETTETVDKIQAHLEELGWHGQVRLVVSGTAKGGDKAGELYASRYDIEIKEMPADWKNLGRCAGYRRNEAMAKEATHLLAIWDGKSKGTKHMIDIGRRGGLEVAVRRFRAAPMKPRKRSGRKWKSPVDNQ